MLFKLCLVSFIIAIVCRFISYSWQYHDSFSFDKQKLDTENLKDNLNFADINKYAWLMLILGLSSILSIVFLLLGILFF